MLLIEDNDELAEMVMDRFLAEGPRPLDRETDGAQADALLIHSHFDLLIP